MTSGLHYTRNAKRLKMNVIGDGLPLPNLRNAKRLKMPVLWDWAPYDVRQAAQGAAAVDARGPDTVVEGVAQGAVLSLVRPPMPMPVPVLVLLLM